MPKMLEQSNNADNHGNTLKVVKIMIKTFSNLTVYKIVDQVAYDRAIRHNRLYGIVKPVYEGLELVRIESPDGLKTLTMEDREV